MAENEQVEVGADETKNLFSKTGSLGQARCQAVGLHKFNQVVHRFSLKPKSSCSRVANEIIYFGFCFRFWPQQLFGDHCFVGGAGGKCLSSPYREKAIAALATNKTMPKMRIQREPSHADKAD